jgi:hypothetical protein
MKAERRHELKQNTLAHSLENLPELSRRHGTKILVVVMVGLLVVMLIRNRVTSSRTAATEAAYSINRGRDLIEQLHDASERVPSTQFVTMAQEFAKGVDQTVQHVLDTSDDPRLLAEARLVQGDFNWELAALPDPPGAATRPQLALAKSDDQLLNSAASAYQTVVDDRNAPKDAVTSARLGLAAVAEQRKQWDTARDHYQRVVDDPAAPKPLKDLAAGALSRLQNIQKTPLLAEPATQPSTTGPATTQSATAPASAPATNSADAKPQAAPSPQDAQDSK